MFLFCAKYAEPGKIFLDLQFPIHLGCKIADFSRMCVVSSRGRVALRQQRASTKKIRKFGNSNRALQKLNVKLEITEKLKKWEFSGYNCLHYLIFCSTGQIKSNSGEEFNCYYSKKPHETEN